MRLVAGSIVVLLTAVALYAEGTPPASGDLKGNPLVQKALTDQDKAVVDADAVYANKLEAIKTERQKKLDSAKMACVATLRRAETVATTRNNKDEALTIKALADSIRS